MGYPVAYRAGSWSPGSQWRPSTPPAARSASAPVNLHGGAKLYQFPRAPVPPAAAPYAGYAGPVGSFGGEYSPARAAPRAPASWKPPLPGLPAAASTSLLRLATRLLPQLGAGILVLEVLAWAFRWLFRVVLGVTSWEAAGWSYTACAGKGPPTHRSSASGDPKSFICLNNQGLLSFPLHQPVFSDRTWFYGITQQPSSLSSSHWHITGTYGRTLANPNVGPVTTPDVTQPAGMPDPYVQPAELPAMHPLLNPIGAPRNLPRAVPYRGPGTAARPLDMPGLGRVGGYAAPRAAVPPPLSPEVPEAWVITPEGVSIPLTPVGRMPPGRGEKEKKVWAQRMLAGIAKAAFALTEFNDLLDSLIDAMPKRYRPESNKLREKLNAIWDHWDQIDAGEAVQNIASNYIEDKVVGYFNQKSASALKSKFGATATGINTGAGGLPQAPSLPSF